jgi:hypothetical protein
MLSLGTSSDCILIELHRRRNRTAMLVLPGCQRFGHTPRNKQGSSEGDLYIQLAASNILWKAIHYCNSAIVVPALSRQLPSIAFSVRPATFVAQSNDRTAARFGPSGEVRRMDVNRVAVMRIQASYRTVYGTPLRLLQRRPLPSRLVYYPPIADQLATAAAVLYCIYCTCVCVIYTCRRHAHFPGAGRRSHHCRSQLRCVRKTAKPCCTASPQRCRSLPGTVCFAPSAHLTSPRVASV